MKLKVLVDNNTLIDRYFLGEPGVSYYIEAEGKKILFDLGYSDIFLRNGEKMGIDFLDIDYLVFSHSHLDHTWGLEPFLKTLTEGILEQKVVKRPTLVAHPEVFSAKTTTGFDEYGITLDKEKTLKYCVDGMTSKPFWITERLVFLGEIPRQTSFEANREDAPVIINGVILTESFIDDTALCYKTEDGLVIVTGCSHSGICNIIEYAKKVCGDQRVVDVIGGFHLLDPHEKQLAGTVDYFSELQMKLIHACHCTDLSSKIALSSVVEVKEVGVGLELTF